jgi:hypothetical protein
MQFMGAIAADPVPVYFPAADYFGVRRHGKDN